MPRPSAALRKRLGYQRWLVSRAMDVDLCRPIAVGPRLYKRILLRMMPRTGPTLADLRARAWQLLRVPPHCVTVETDGPGSVLVRVDADVCAARVEMAREEMQRELPLTVALRTEAHRAEGR